MSCLLIALCEHDIIVINRKQVYVLDEQKQLVMVMGLKPTEVEKSMENITM